MRLEEILESEEINEFITPAFTAAVMKAAQLLKKQISDIEVIKTLAGYAFMDSNNTLAQLRHRDGIVHIENPFSNKEKEVHVNANQIEKAIIDINKKAPKKKLFQKFRRKA
jgi:hypothetical protein